MLCVPSSLLKVIVRGGSVVQLAGPGHEDSGYGCLCGRTYAFARMGSSDRRPLPGYAQGILVHGVAN